MRRPTQSEWTRIITLFDTLIDLPGDVRESRLTEKETDPFVIDHVRALLVTDGRAGVLDTLVPRADPTRPAEYASLAGGTVIGAFRIERLVGRGGMGEVYLARREAVDFQQQVALKLLRPEAVGRAALLDAERQMLAGLEHPGIARLIDGGMAPDGRAFMAMEYVEGEDIGTWCATEKADLSTRLRLFLEVCEAVAYAHARLVLHLDIKPSNIMVDGDGRVRLLDFGVARMIDAAATDRTMTRAPLTPEYAAPEQFAGARPTVATDIYALGTTLYELLAGTGPWKWDNAPLPTVLRRLLHDDPPYPSKVATAAGVGSARIAGDLDAIVMRAMRRNPAERYDSVATLAADIRRHLAFEPVEARAGTLRYRAGRFVRRNRWQSAAAAVLVLVLVAGAGGIAWQARATAIERDIARSEARKAQAVNTAIALMFGNARASGQSGAVSARDLLNESANELIGSFSAASPDTVPVVAAIAELFVQIDDPVAAEALVTKALKAGVASNNAEARATLAATLGTAQASMGKFSEATKQLDSAERVWRTDPQRYAQQRLELVSSRAIIMRLEGKREEGIKLLTDTLPEAERVYAGKPRELLTRYNNLIVHLLESNRIDEAEAVLVRAEAFMRANRIERSSVAIGLIQLRGGIHARRNQHEQALQYFRRAAALRRQLYGPSIGLANDQLAVGRTMLGLAQVREAIPVLKEALSLSQTYVGGASQQAIMAGLSLAEGHSYLGELSEAQAALDAIRPGVDTLGDQHLLRGVYLRARGQLRVAEGKFDEAERDYDRAEQVFVATGPAGAAFVASTPVLRKALAEARSQRR